MKQIVLEYAVLRWNPPIVHIEFNSEAELGLPEIHELTRTCEILSRKTPYLVLSDVRANVTVTSIGKKVAGDPSHAPLHRGTAVLVSNMLLEMAANFFSHLKKQPFPFKAFTDKEDAVEWLLQIPVDAVPSH